METSTSLITDTARALGFLSRLPVPDRYFDGSGHDMAGTARTFALAGALLALPSALLLACLVALDAPPLLAAVLSVGLLIALTGALHEDGLADTADAIAMARDRQKALAIMHDSHIGVFAVLALVLTLMIRVTALAAILTGSSVLAGPFAVIAVAAISRAAMVWHWWMLPAARSDGVASAAGRPTGPAMATAIVSAILVALVCLPAVLGFTATMAALAVTFVSGLVFTRRVRIRLGGHTGDTIGATQQITEAACLATLALFA